MFVKGAKFPKRGPNFLGPPGTIFPRKFGPGGQIFGGAKFPVTPVNYSLDPLLPMIYIRALTLKFGARNPTRLPTAMQYLWDVIVLLIA